MKNGGKLKRGISNVVINLNLDFLSKYLNLASKESKKVSNFTVAII